MRVLWLVHYPVFGGPHNRIVRTYPYLGREGVDVVAGLPLGKGDAADRLRAAGVEVRQMPLGRLRNPASVGANVRYLGGIPGDVKRLRSLIRQTRSDVIVVGGLANPQGAIAGRLEGIGVVWQLIDSRFPRPVAGALMPLVDRLADVAMFGGRALLTAHPGADRLSTSVVVRPPSVDTDQFRPSAERRASIRTALGIPPSAPVVGMVANMNPQKGIQYFAKAAALIHEAVPDAYFVLVGARHSTHRRYEAQVMRIIERARLPGERFVLAGSTSEPERWYPAMDVKLITSVPRSEGTTTTAMEALACGVPVVATRVGAIEEVVRDGETGLLVDPCDSTAIAEATTRLLEDRQLANELRRAGRSMVVSEFGAAAGAADHLRAFELAAKQRRGPRGSARG